MKRILFVLLFVPMLANAALWTLPSGKIFEEKITYHRTLSGVLVSVSEWKEVFGGVIKKVNASDLSLEDTIKNFIRSMSDIQGIDKEFMVRLASCESMNFNSDVVFNKKLGDKGKAMGLYQWWLKSWNYYNKIYKTELDRTSWMDQVRMSVKVVDDYGTDDWLNCTHWIRTGKGLW